MDAFRKDSFISGYIVTIINSSGSTESTSVGSSARHFLKRNLTPNSTYSISVAARTKEGTGPKSTNIVVVLGEPQSYLLILFFNNSFSTHCFYSIIAIFKIFEFLFCER